MDTKWFLSSAVAVIIFCQSLVTESLGLQLGEISLSLGTQTSLSALVFPARYVGTVLGCVFILFLHHTSTYRLQHRLLVVANFGVFLMGTSIGMLPITSGLANVLTVVGVFGVGSGVFFSCVIPQLIRVWGESHPLSLQINFLFHTLGHAAAHFLNNLYPNVKPGFYDPDNLVYSYLTTNMTGITPSQQEAMRLLFAFSGIVICVSGMVIFCYAMRMEKKVRIVDATGQESMKEEVDVIDEPKPDWTLTIILFLSGSTLNFIVQYFPNFVRSYLIITGLERLGLSERVAVIMKLLSVAAVLFQIPFVHFKYQNITLVKINLLSTILVLVTFSLFPDGNFIRWFLLISFAAGTSTTYANTLTWANSRTNLTPRITAIYTLVHSSVEFICSTVATRSFLTMHEALFYNMLLFSFASWVMFYVTQTAEWIDNNATTNKESEIENDDVIIEQKLLPDDNTPSGGQESLNAILPLSDTEAIHF